MLTQLLSVVRQPGELDCESAGEPKSYSWMEEIEVRRQKGRKGREDERRRNGREAEKRWVEGYSVREEHWKGKEKSRVGKGWVKLAKRRQKDKVTIERKDWGRHRADSGRQGVNSQRGSQSEKEIIQGGNSLMCWRTWALDTPGLPFSSYSDKTKHWTNLLTGKHHGRLHTKLKGRWNLGRLNLCPSQKRAIKDINMFNLLSALPKLYGFCWCWGEDVGMQKTIKFDSESCR